jgi:hypothetical protein
VCMSKLLMRTCICTSAVIGCGVEISEETAMRRFDLFIATFTATAVVFLSVSTAAGAVEPDNPMPTGGGAQVGASVSGHSEGTADGVVEVDIPDRGAEPVETEAAAGRLTMDLPASGRDLASDGDTALFDGSGRDNAIAVESTTNGVRALVYIDSDEAPERFVFPIGGDVVALRPTSVGGVEALNADGETVAVAAAPWAVDANGSAVPTHFEIAGTRLIQVIEHRDGHYAYGIVADPSWGSIFSTAWKVAKCVAVLAANSVVAYRLIRGLKAGLTIAEFAKLLVKGTYKAEKLLAVAGAVIGIDSIVSACL